MLSLYIWLTFILEFRHLSDINPNETRSKPDRVEWDGQALCPVARDCGTDHAKERSETEGSGVVGESGRDADASPFLTEEEGNPQAGGGSGGKSALCRG